MRSRSAGNRIIRAQGDFSPSGVTQNRPPRADRAGTRSWPECHGHLAGLVFRSRLSPRLPDREVPSLVRSESRQAVGIILTAASAAAISSNTGRGAGGPSCRRNNEHRAENQPESHDLNYGRPRENAATALQKRSFSSFEEKMGPHPETETNGR